MCQCPIRSSYLLVQGYRVALSKREATGLPTANAILSPNNVLYLLAKPQDTVSKLLSSLLRNVVPRSVCEFPAVRAYKMADKQVVLLWRVNCIIQAFKHYRWHRDFRLCRKSRFDLLVGWIAIRQSETMPV